MPSAGMRSPDRLFTYIPGLNHNDARHLAMRAAYYAKREAPKLTGTSARRIHPIYGQGWFGIHWLDPQVWFQNSGVHPFVMRSLAGKIIPMWLDDPTGKIRTSNPKAKTRTTVNGRVQVLIFRRAAMNGQRKLTHRKIAGAEQIVSVPMSYPGAPGRISLREAGKPNTSAGKLAGQIARHNVGIRWYFPGLSPRNFLQQGIIHAGQDFGIQPHAILTGYSFYDTQTLEPPQSAVTSKKTKPKTPFKTAGRR